MADIDNMDNIVLGTHYEGCWRHMGHHGCAVTKVEQLWVKVEQLCHELHDERIRRDEWEKMYNQAIAGTEVEQPRERPGYWKHVDLKVAQTERSKQLAEVERLLKTALDNEIDSRVSVELEVERLQAELTRIQTDVDEAWAENARLAESYQGDADVVCEALGTEWTPDNEYPTVALSAITQLQAELAQLQIEHEIWDKLSLVEIATEHDKLRAELALTRVKLNRVRQDAQDQSDEVQELWLSPCEAEGLKRQLAKAEALAALVTPELAELLEQLADGRLDGDKVIWWGDAQAAARAVATRIREALGETE